MTGLTKYKNYCRGINFLTFSRACIETLIHSHWLLLFEQLYLRRGEKSQFVQNNKQFKILFKPKRVNCVYIRPCRILTEPPRLAHPPACLANKLFVKLFLWTHDLTRHGERLKQNTFFVCNCCKVAHNDF